MRRKPIESTTRESRKQTPANPKRTRVLQAAFSAFQELGYAGASTLAIATRAKVSKRELYTLFSNKQAMLAACIAERTKRMRLHFQVDKEQRSGLRPGVVEVITLIKADEPKRFITEFFLQDQRAISIVAQIDELTGMSIFSC
jgi:AcrR family transcriptional regulator